MAFVTIKGSTTPCVELERGEVRTVQHTDRVQRLINAGYVDVVEFYGDAESEDAGGALPVAAVGSGVIDPEAEPADESGQ